MLQEMLYCRAWQFVENARGVSTKHEAREYKQFTLISKKLLVHAIGFFVCVRTTKKATGANRQPFVKTVDRCRNLIVRPERLQGRRGRRGRPVALGTAFRLLERPVRPGS